VEIEKEGFQKDCCEHSKRISLILRPFGVTLI